MSAWLALGLAPTQWPQRLTSVSDADQSPRLPVAFDNGMNKETGGIARQFVPGVVQTAEGLPPVHSDQFRAQRLE